MSHRTFATLLSVLSILAVRSPAHAQGLLLPVEPGLGPLAVKSQRVSADIKDGTAVTRLTQVFVNDAARPLEAHYVFPLPKGAALSEFYLWINGKKTRAELLEKEKASAIYEGIVRRLQDPGLLEYIDSDVFRARVFPVPARGEQKIELAFSQVLDFSGGLYHYRYPLGGGGHLQNVAGAVRQDFTFSATLASKVPLRSIYSPTHPLQVSRKGEGNAVVGLEMGPGTLLTRDLDVYYSVSEKAVGLSLMTYQEASEPGYFLALVSPKQELQKDEILGKRITFVIDTSGSMSGERIKMARDALKYCVTRLSEKDRFNVVRFATDVEALFDTPRDASKDAVQKAVAFVDSLEALGGTAIDEAMRRALKDGEAGGSGPHVVLFVTDGQPTIGETSEATIARNAAVSNKGKSRVFTFGVGEDLNARLLDRLASDGQGVSDFVKGGKDLEEKISGFYDKMSHPVLADVSLDLSSMGAYDVYPRKLPDLFKGSQLVVLGRYRQTGDVKATLSGSVNGAAKKFDYGTTTSAAEHKAEDFLPRLWAIRKVGYLLEEIRLRGEKPELRDEVVALGKKFGIVTPYTSYLVVEDTPIAGPVRPQPPGWRRDRPIPMPEGAAGASIPSSPPASAFAPSRTAGFEDRAFEGVVAAGRSGGDVLSRAEGKAGIDVSKKMKAMKEESFAPKPSDPVRVAGGRSYLWRSSAWVDSEVLEKPGQQLKVKYLSPAYFALVHERADLKAGLALGNRVVLRVGAGKSVAIAPEEGEEAAERVVAFLK